MCDLFVVYVPFYITLYVRHSLLTSYSQGVREEKYSSIEVILVAESIKLVASGFLSVWQSSKKTGSGFWLYRLLNLLWNGRKVIILVILYSISNTIPLYAISRIGAPIFTVCIQLKVFTTAAFATVMLGRKYSSTKWRALLLLIVGCILVASPILTKSGSSGDGEGESELGESVLGLGAVMVQVMISGFSAVYFEALLKDKDDTTTIWERNFQLSFYSILFLVSYLVSTMVSNSLSPPIQQGAATSPSQDQDMELFSGWTECTVGVALLQGAGGLIVAATLKYADAVLKCFATAVSIIIVSVLGYLFLGNDIDLFAALGMLVTVISIFNYTLDHAHN
jgi:solute carrier family 35 (UDP-sugar transporter), member A1/2/3